MCKIIEDSRMKIDYRDIVGIGLDGHILQSPPWINPLDLSVEKYGQPVLNIFWHGVKFFSTIMFLPYSVQ